MKKINDLQWIERRIAAASGLPFAGPRPELFFRPPAECRAAAPGPNIFHYYNDENQYPHVVTTWYAASGRYLIMATAGLN